VARTTGFARGEVAQHVQVLRALAGVQEGHLRRGTPHHVRPLLAEQAQRRRYLAVQRDRQPGELAEWINPVVRSWMNYYGKFYRTTLNGLLRRINTYLVRWHDESSNG
jgi:hypothetical protein